MRQCVVIRLETNKRNLADCTYYESIVLQKNIHGSKFGQLRNIVQSMRDACGIHIMLSLKSG